MKTLLTTLVVLSGLATPTFAQSFCNYNGTGNLLPFGNNRSPLRATKLHLVGTG
jgi:hypothetical protein